MKPGPTLSRCLVHEHKFTTWFPSLHHYAQTDCYLMMQCVPFYDWVNCLYEMGCSCMFCYSFCQVNCWVKCMGFRSMEWLHLKGSVTCWSRINWIIPISDWQNCAHSLLFCQNNLLDSNNLGHMWILLKLPWFLLALHARKSQKLHCLFTWHVFWVVSQVMQWCGLFTSLVMHNCIFPTMPQEITWLYTFVVKKWRMVLAICSVAWWM